MLDCSQEEVASILESILLEAVKKSASDIHFEIYQKTFRIRFRIQGLLYDHLMLNPEISNYLIARIKVLANLDIAERRLPQDGHFVFQTKHEINLRISTLPTLFGEKVVLRLLDNVNHILPLSALGLLDNQLSEFLQAINRPQGLILITGPTGSGKTITLYSAVNHLNNTRRNICAVEDPNEIQLEGINQVQVNPKIGLDFAKVLRAFLRQDPDIIMVGEIRDAQTAQMAIKAAQTGHLVLASLHTTDVAQTIARLKNLSISSFDITSCLILIVAQRLVRILCTHCKVPIKERVSSNDKDKIIVYRACGCGECIEGYQGRTGIFELLVLDQTINEMIIANKNLGKFRALNQAGIAKINLGVTSPQELKRVLNTYV